MSTVAFLGVPIRGHMGPTTAVVAELVRRGHSVTYHTSREFAEELAAAGASVRLYPEVTGHPVRPEATRDAVHPGATRDAVDLEAMPHPVRPEATRDAVHPWTTRHAVHPGAAGHTVHPEVTGHPDRPEATHHEVHAEATRHAVHPGATRLPAGRPTPLGMLDGIARAAVDLLPQVLAELRDIRPDLIVHDSACYWGAVAARELGVRAVSLYSTFAYNEYAPSPTRVSWRLAAEAALHPRTAFRYLRARRTLHRHHDTRGLPRYDLLDVRQPLNLVFTSREFQPGAGVFDSSHPYTDMNAQPRNLPFGSDGTAARPRDASYGSDGTGARSRNPSFRFDGMDARPQEASYQFVGPCVGARPRDPAFPIDRLQAPVRVSLGSAPTARPRLLRAMVTALAPIGGTVVIATGGTDPASLGPLPDNVIARPFVPQNEVLLRAALFITHGGLTSVNEALDAGVPMLVIPGDADQPLVAARVVQLGAGLSISRREADARVVHALARRLLSRLRFQAAADGLQVAQREAGGHTRAADELEHYLHAAFHPAQADSPRER